MLIVIYQFQVLPGKEEEFRHAWAETTQYIYQNFDSLGSRLHRSETGAFVAYAQWPDAATFDLAHPWCEKGQALKSRMKETLDPKQPTTAQRLVVDTDLLKRAPYFPPDSSEE